MLLRRIIRVILGILTALCGLSLLLSAWAGTVDPRTLPVSAVVAMTAPICIAVTAIVLVLDLIWCRRGAIFAAACLLTAAPSVMSNFPVHPFAGKLTEEQKKRSWTLLSYNVYNFLPANGYYPDSINQTMEYIIRADADVVALQEAESFGCGMAYCIRPWQIDSLKRRYRHIIQNGKGMCLLSKYPVTPLRSSFASRGMGQGDCAAYAIDIDGHRVALFSVHLQSIGLTGEDKTMFRELTDIRGDGEPRPSLGDVRRQLVTKLAEAAVKRADHADMLIRDIARYGGENVIVCGDFNDVPGCWALHRLSDCGMREVYPEVGTGYMRTYNKNRFWFRIDHILYRGRLKPVSMHRGSIVSSDHFPVMATFVFDE